jgi:hypothetical protein
MSSIRLLMLSTFLGANKILRLCKAEKGLGRRLDRLEPLKMCGIHETIVAIENWLASGLLSDAEANELMRYHGLGGS